MHLRTCSLCGDVFKTQIKHSKYCDDCRKIVNKINQLNSKITRYHLNQLNSKITRYHQVIEDAEIELELFIIDREKRTR